MNFKILIILWVGSKLECDCSPGFSSQILPQSNQVTSGLTYPSWFYYYTNQGLFILFTFSATKESHEPGAEVASLEENYLERSTKSLTDKTGRLQTYLGRGGGKIPSTANQNVVLP